MVKTKVDINNKMILITGAAGFIGYHMCIRLLKECEGSTIIGIDNISDFTPITLKEWRLSEIEKAAENRMARWIFLKNDISDKEAVDAVFDEYKPTIVVNLAAQAGVRYSIDNPYAYLKSNIEGFLNILEACRHNIVEHLVYASSSSVYGGNTKVPFSIGDNVDHPVSLYAASKRSDELMAHAYAKLYDIPCTGLRFFTVYGPGGRPDMAYYKFAEQLVRSDSIKVYNYGNCQRDFTYIDDIIEGIFRVMQGAPKHEKGVDGLPIAPYALYNIGGGSPVNLMDFIQILAYELVNVGLLPRDFELSQHEELHPMQAGDVPMTCADSIALEEDYGFRPMISIEHGIKCFVQWFADYR